MPSELEYEVYNEQQDPPGKTTARIKKAITEALRDVYAVLENIKKNGSISAEEAHKAAAVALKLYERQEKRKQAEFRAEAAKLATLKSQLPGDD